MTPDQASLGQDKKILRVLNGETIDPPPMWLMRQAGRYLSEYRAVRAQAGGFLDLCFNPKLAAEVTLQPIRRFGFDAAILFSDILVIPHALGQTVAFAEGEGPRLSPTINDKGLSAFGSFDLRRLEPVLDALRLVRQNLPAETTMIGFCGAPWTVASYMVAGRGSPDLAVLRMFAYRHPDQMQSLIDILVEASIEYLCAQADAGAEVLQIFDSWAGLIPAREFQRWCVEPVQRIVSALRTRKPCIRVIVFSRGAGTNLELASQIAPDACMGLDTAENLDVATRLLPAKTPVQGNLDPLALIAGGDALKNAVLDIRRALAGRPYIFNLGHGILPETPIAHVEQLVALVRAPLGG